MENAGSISSESEKNRGKLTGASVRTVNRPGVCGDDVIRCTISGNHMRERPRQLAPRPPREVSRIREIGRGAVRSIRHGKRERTGTPIGLGLHIALKQAFKFCHAFAQFAPYPCEETTVSLLWPRL